MAGDNWLVHHSILAPIETKLLIYLLFSYNHFRLNDRIEDAIELMYDIIFEYVDWLILCMTLYTCCRTDKILAHGQGTCILTEMSRWYFFFFFNFLFFDNLIIRRGKFES